ncbi:MAG: polyprenyl synthetase family protein [Clostridia bacterium]|nr:polyprenyl synthetase family protein [Clostridia bacterium]
MNSEEFKSKFENKLQLALSNEIIGDISPLSDAIRYAAMSGGKRLRPQCVRLGAEFAKGAELNKTELENVLDLAISVELVHTYSLVHDDLPAMDNDDFRRGRPTVHREFGEDIAILAGDALLNLAYERLFELVERVSSSKVLSAASEIAKNAGIFGMVKGQCLDLNGEIESAEDILTVNRYKTGCLFKASILSGAILLNSTAKELEALEIYADNLGATFQIVDDLLDSDKQENSIVKMIGESDSKKLAEKFTQNAISSISKFEMKNNALKKFAQNLVERTS